MRGPGRIRFALALAVSVVLLAGSAHAQHTGPDACPDAIGPATAQTFFEQLRAVHAPDGCTLEGASTERVRMQVRWSKAGTELPAVSIEPVACAAAPSARGTTYAVTALDAFRRACPVTYDAVIATVHRVDTPAAPEERSFSRGAALASGIAELLALALGLAMAVRALRRGAREETSEPPRT